MPGRSLRRAGRSGQLSPGDAQQQAVQPRQRQLTGRARTAEREQPLRRLIVWPAAASARTSSRRGALGSGGVNWWYVYRSYEAGSGTRLRAGTTRPGRNPVVETMHETLRTGSPWPEAAGESGRRSASGSPSTEHGARVAVLARSADQVREVAPHWATRSSAGPIPGSALASYLEYRQRTWPTTTNPTCSSTPNC